MLLECCLLSCYQPAGFLQAVVDAFHCFVSVQASAYDIRKTVILVTSSVGQKNQPFFSNMNKFLLATLLVALLSVFALAYSHLESTVMQDASELDETF